jgi:glucans biosynthesis protein
MKLLCVIGSLSLLLLVTVACDTMVQPDNTLLQSSQHANLSSESDLPPVSGETLFKDVVERARLLSQTAYERRVRVLPEALNGLDYDQYRSIRFRPEAAFWKNIVPFELQLFHPGSRQRDTVLLHLVEEGRINAVSFDSALFQYSGSVSPVAGMNGPEFGHAGFRIHYPLNDAAVSDEVIVFLGASYFRMLSRGHVYGLSCRGLAVDTGLNRGEEFPVFQEFWLVRPDPGVTTMTFYALLDSPSVTGAYRFDLHPGAPTNLDVEAKLFARDDIVKLGVAPMSSMFLYGPNRIPHFDDFRPQVHDSDGLLIHMSTDEWIWRPLSNGPQVHVTTHPDQTPNGFGLVQRDRNFESYLDVEASYHRRPSAWITPSQGDWGSGHVELLTYASGSEFNDNVAAYWVTDAPFKAGDERYYRYRVTMFDDRLETQTLAQVVHTRIGRDALPGELEPSPRSHRRFVVDFTLGQDIPSEVPDPVLGVLDSSTGQVSDLVVHRLPDERGWRASFRLIPYGNAAAELRLYLVSGQQRLTETWSYVWYPDHVID